MINVYNNIYIDADDLCFMLVTWDGKKNEKGGIINASRKYYSSFSSLLQGLANMMLREKIKSNQTETVNDLFQEVLNIESFLKKISEKLFNIDKQKIKEGLPVELKNGQ